MKDKQRAQPRNASSSSKDKSSCISSGANSATISQSKLNTLLGQNKPAAKVPQATVRTKPESINKPSRPASAKYKPVHLSAPFKTQPDVKRKPKVTSSRTSSAASRPKSGHSRPSVIQVKPAPKGAEGKNLVREGNERKHSEPDKQTCSREMKESYSSQDSVEQWSMDKVNNWMSNMNLEEWKQDSITDNTQLIPAPVTREHKTQFSLLTDGSVLQIYSLC